MIVYKGKMLDKEILDRIAEGDDKYTLTQLDDWRVKLDPNPDRVVEAGTPINKALLQEMYDRIMALWNYVYDAEENTFSNYLNDLDALLIEGRINNNALEI